MPERAGILLSEEPYLGDLQPDAPSKRRDQIEVFLRLNGWRLQDCRVLAADASFRTYHRLQSVGRRAVLMDAPPPQEDVRSFALLARHLRKLGLSAPAVLAEDAEAGLLLLEDLGDETFTRQLDGGTDPYGLYGLAIDVLVDLHRRPASEAVPHGLPVYDERRYLEECCLLIDWYWPAVMGGPMPSDLYQEYVEAWQAALQCVHVQPQTLVLRDFHVDNLTRLASRSGVAACGLLDFQDAVAGPAAYDLVSLVEDARRDVDDRLRADMLARYRQAFPSLRWDTFATACAVLAAQRHAKVIGIFTRLCVRDGKAQYLHHIPRVWRLLESALGREVVQLAPVKAWLDRHLPPEARRIPVCPPAATP